MSIACTSPVHLLLVEDNSCDAELFQASLQGSVPSEFIVTHVRDFEEAVARTQSAQFDLVVLDLSLPDSYGMNTIVNACHQLANIPVVVMTGTIDEVAALQALQMGIQDYLVKGEFVRERLRRALRYALMRHTRQEGIKAASMTDELTGLNNRRGFFALLEQQIKLVRRFHRELYVLYADVDRFKWINDTYGHQEGDAALRDVADILRCTFRASDVLARLGGDEFAVIAVQQDAVERCAEMLMARLQQSLDQHNALRTRTYPLWLSMGVAQYELSDATSTEELLAKADSAMYAHKRSKKQPSRTIK